jgi:hypothetical protein
MPTKGETGAERMFEDAVAVLGGIPDVTRKTGRGFASGGLFWRGRLFATLRGDHLLLKLPAARVAALIGSDHASPFDANKGKPMREWALVGSDGDWAALAREALAFAQGA